MAHASPNPRKTAMEAFAQAEKSELDAGLAEALAESSWNWLRKPETGMIMARGRTGGSGAPFNLGEVTVTRCAVVLDGMTGFATVMGRDKDKARLAALADAVWQDESHRPDIEARIVRPVLQRLEQQDNERRAETDATRVEFFTMARGED